MKRNLLIILLLVSASSSAQTKTSAPYYLGLPQDSIVKVQNMMISVFTNNPKALWQLEFVSSRINDLGGVTLTYRSIIPKKGKIYYTYEDYVFNSRDELIHDIILLGADDEYEQVNLMLKNYGYYNVNEHLLYHKTDNVKVVIETKRINDADWALFNYTKKETKTPYD